MKYIFLVCIFPLLICGCKEVSGPPNTPELTSKKFFEAIYIHKDINKTKPYVDEALWKLIYHYRIASSVQRQLLNLTMRNVDIEIEHVDADFFRKFTDETTVKVKLRGTKNNRKWVDSRTLKLSKQENEQWVIYGIVPEKLR